MADKKISALTAATTPLAGTEVLPIVQSGTTVKVSAADVTAGRAVSMDSATITGGTANGVAYLNASKVLTTGTAIQYSGGNLGLNVTPAAAYGYEYTVTLDATNGWAGFGQKQLSATNATTYITNNAKNAGAFAWNYAGPTAYAATLYQQNVGQHQFYTAPAGTGAITFAQAFTIDANATVNTGNLVIGTAGKGIDFSANGGDVLKQYDEGTWTPVVTASAGSITSYTSSGRFTRIGRMVTAVFTFKLTNAGTASGAIIVTLPFSGDAAITYVGCGRDDNLGSMVQGRIQTTVPGSVYLVTYANASIAVTNTEVFFSIQYFV